MIIFEIEQLVITLLLIASLVGILVKWLRMPYTVGLVVIGLLLALWGPEFHVPEALGSRQNLFTNLLPSLILGTLIPPLIFEAAFHIQARELRRELPLILTFAIPGVILTMFLVGGVVAWGSGMALPVALLLGALLAATDPVAVIALFRSLGAPPRLSLIIEGESLFNDGTAVVIFNIMLAILATGAFELTAGIREFLIVSAGGLLIGGVIGYMGSAIINRVDDYLIEISITIVTAYGSFLVAEHYHFAGVLAVVAAGLVSGNVGPRGMSPLTQQRLLEFWEFAAFLANSFVFLVIGLVIDLQDVLNNLGPILLVLVAVLLARLVVIYGFSLLFRSVTASMQHVLFWGGLRGAISLALALSLTPLKVGPDLPQLQTMAFGVVLFTMIVQGTTMETLMEKLRLIKQEPPGDPPPSLD